MIGPSSEIVSIRALLEVVSGTFFPLSFDSRPEVGLLVGSVEEGSRIVIPKRDDVAGLGPKRSYTERRAAEEETNWEPFHLSS